MAIVGYALLALFLLVLAIAIVGYWRLRRRYQHRWLGTYLREPGKRRPPEPESEVHVLLCFADHYEPKAYKADKATGLTRVERWAAEYPKQFSRFRDADGRPPRWSFFFPEEEYEPEFLDLLAGLCRQGFGEVEIHLHHQRDNAEAFRQKLIRLRDLLSNRHGLLGRDRQTQHVRYAFIHGNWALCNSRPNGTGCGVNGEIPVLLDTGCYADLTFPSAPDTSQPPIINSIYYAWDHPGRPASHFEGVPLGATPPPNSLLLIQGPLVLNWRHRKFGLLPRVENSCLQESQPPTMERLDCWLRARVQAPGRPDWYFVKLHAHGAPEDAHHVLLGEPMVAFHEALAERARRDRRFHVHYVTAREMYNLAKAAEAGFRGSVDEARDYAIGPPPG